MTDTPIGDYALISDCQTGALVSRSGSIDWLPWPRFDSPSVFGRLLGEDAGTWHCAPVGHFASERSYVEGSMVLETCFTTESGVVVVTDALIFDEGSRGHEIGRRVPHVLTRVVRGVRGDVVVEAEFAPRPEYGAVRPRLRTDDRSVLSGGGATVLRLAGPQPDRIDDATARWELEVREGDEIAFALHYATTTDDSVDAWSGDEIVDRVADTVSGWQSWSDDHQSYVGPWAEQVRFGGRVLQALTYAPTGAVVAAPTTSLPEHAGGMRNWDYRYSWLRDASLTMNALWVAACPDEAERFFEWILNASGASTADGSLQVMYGIGGEHDLSERELVHLDGWRGSRPVRVGNGAWEQHQNDIFGEVLDAASRLQDQLDPKAELQMRFLADLADRAIAVWSSPDDGIWEARAEPEHYLYSKLMCWVALDRAISMASWMGAGDRVQEWTSARDEMRAAILEQGWNEEAGFYAQTFGGAALDASTLMLAITGFHRATDPRMMATIEAIAAQLTDDRGFVFRYRVGDGLEGDEGTFVICTFWLVECLALAGQVERATTLFEAMLAQANDVGLLSEQLASGDGELLGNYPQAFSHIGLINAAEAIGRARAHADAAGETG